MIHRLGIFVALYLACGVLVAAAGELTDRVAGTQDWREMVEDTAFVVCCWPRILWAIIRRA